jgi:N-acetyl-anhydromuramyl-L-alanine amidase AmpD
MKAEDVKYIVVHCSDSPQGRGDNAETIHLWHIQKGWDGIGYHRVILEDGTVENGRPLYWVGSHARGNNSKSVGVCLIGDGIYTPQQWHALRELIFKLLTRFPGAAVVGHNDLDSGKTCPKFDVKAWWAD